MCNPISGIMKSDGTVFMPRNDAWQHSHSQIAEEHGLPDGLMGDSYARFEVSPKGYQDGGDWRLFRDEATGAIKPVDNTWSFKLDETRMPGWFKDDAPALTEKCRQAAKRWLDSFPEHLVPGARVTAGYAGTATAGDAGTATAGDGGTATAGARGTATAGDGGIIVLRRWDGKRFRLIVQHIGEDGFKPGVKYRWDESQKKVVEA